MKFKNLDYNLKLYKIVFKFQIKIYKVLVMENYNKIIYKKSFKKYTDAII